MLKVNRILSIFTLVVLSTSCSVNSGNIDVRATAGRPDSAQVGESVELTLDSQVPRVAVLIEPFVYAAANVRSSDSGYQSPSPVSTAGEVIGELENNMNNFPPSYGQEQIGQGLSAQLTTALSKSGRVSILDRRFLASAPQDYSKLTEKDEIGPILIRGTVTEFNEVADTAEKSNGLNVGVVGALVGLLGAIVDNQALVYTGTGITTANPTITSRESLRKGMVAIDLEIVDAKRGRILEGFQVSGTFTSKSSVDGVSVFGISHGSSDFAASAIGQATRVAINDAVSKVGQVLNKNYNKL